MEILDNKSKNKIISLTYRPPGGKVNQFHNLLNIVSNGSNRKQSCISGQIQVFLTFSFVCLSDAKYDYKLYKIKKFCYYLASVMYPVNTH